MARSSSQALRRGLRSSLDGLGRGRSYATRVLTRDPIDVASGEVVLRQVDVSLDGVLPLVVERTHLSFYTHGRLFGPSWASTLDQRLEIDDEGVCLAAEDGMVLAFPPPPLGKSVLRTLSGKHLTWYYEWDADDRLIALTTPAGQRWRYRYDAFGRRVAKQRLNRDGGTLAEQVDFVWDGAVLAEQTHTRWRPDGPVARTTTWNHEPDTFWPLSQTERAPLREAPQEWVDRQFHAIVTDLTGSATEMVSPTGEVTWHPTTTLWGDTLGSIGAENDCALRFPGQYHDAESGLNYNFHRYYDPVTARYQSPDPLGLAPQSNPYSYPANPVNWSDQTGRHAVRHGKPEEQIHSRSRQSR